MAARADEEFDFDAWASRVQRISSELRPSVDDIVTNGMTTAAWRAASGTAAAAIICISRTGFTVRSIARFRPKAKILGFSTDERTLRQLTISWGATPYELTGGFSPDTQVARAVELAQLHGEVRTGDLVAVLSGSSQYPGQATDSLRLVRV
ncbi:MAG: pyruvate kinase alpha/beta domain-containing protein [Acidimicrobiales bacterium]